MADGDTDGYGSDSEYSMTFKTGMTNDFTGLPHLSNRDDVYRGYFIPKGQFDFQFAFCFFGFGFWEFAVDHLVLKDLQ